MKNPRSSRLAIRLLRRSWCALVGVLAFGFLPPAAAAVEIYKDSHAALEARVEDLFARLTPDEKLALLMGNAGHFGTAPVPRLGVPAMEMADAGQGVRGGSKTTQGPATAFPSGVTMGSTWDPALIHAVATAIGEEARNKGTGVQVLLGPAVNIQRSPLGGRNGEYFSEDPFLAGSLAVAYIQGMQSTGVAACVKHFACNNEEADRDYVNVLVGERALREIYLPAFERAVKDGKAWSLMTAYNQVNGFHCTANSYVNNDILKTEWAWDGLAMSDWGAVHPTDVARHGNDVEMPGHEPGSHCTPEKLKADLAKGALTPAAVDEAARRVLRAVIRTGLLDGPLPPRDPALVNSAAHDRVALEGALKGIVLLKNDGGVLPLDRTRLHSIAVIGRPATDIVIGAGGSPFVEPLLDNKTQPLGAIKKAAGAGVKVSYLSAYPSDSATTIPDSAVTVPGGGHGFQAAYFNNMDCAGTPVSTRVEKTVSHEIAWDGHAWEGAPSKDKFSARWTGTLHVPQTGQYTLGFTGDDGFRVKLDGATLVESWADGPARSLDKTVRLEAGKAYALTAEYYQNTGGAAARLFWTTPQTPDPYAAAAAAAKKADVAVLIVSTFPEGEGEGHDRVSMDLPGHQETLIKAVVAANPRTIVVLNNGTPVAMKSWIKQVPAILEAWYPGQAGGTAIASILFGDVNPSGKLPNTFGAAREDYPDYKNFPGKDGVVRYAEGIYVGYRHFDHKNLAPLFPFGFGLSYTTFAYGPEKASAADFKAADGVRVQLDIANTGARAGDEIVQLYLHDPAPKIDKPVRELKGFARVSLKPGESQTVTFVLHARDFAYFDVPGKRWKADAGTYEVQIGASSRDIRRKIPVRLLDTFVQPVPLSKDFTAAKIK